MKDYYFDYAATTPVDKEVFSAMEPYLAEEYGNPSSIYGKGQAAKKAIEDARERIAQIINAEPSEIVFTSCATESSNLAIKGVVRERQKETKRKGRIITSQIEHPSVLNTVKNLEEFGWDTVFAPVSNEGLFDLKSLKDNLTDETVLISVMMANNEIGTIEPIEEIGEIIRDANNIREAKKLPRIYFHVDAVQAIQYMEIDVKKYNIDLMSLTGHKFYAPKGIGVLYVKKGTEITSEMHGGAQERRLRAGTENVAAIIGMAKALEITAANRVAETERLTFLRDRIIDEVLKLENVQLTGHRTERLPHIASFVFKYIEGESIVLKLDAKGISAATGSACSSASLEPSHVLTALGIKKEISHGSLRISLGKFTNEAQVNYLLKELPPIISELLEMSAVKGDF